MGKTYIRTATVLVRVNTGPPTWWRPNFSGTKSSRDEPVILRAGWLRLAIEVAIGTKRHSKAEAEEAKQR